MKILLVVGLLAATTAAASRNFHGFPRYGSIFPVGFPYGSIEEDPYSDSEPPVNVFPLPYEKAQLISEIEKFGEKFISHSFNLKNFDCSQKMSDCFPLTLHNKDIPELLTIRALMRHSYGDVYNQLIQEPIADVEQAKTIVDEIWENEKNILNLWNATLFALESKHILRDSFDFFDIENIRGDEIKFFYRSTFDTEKLRQTLTRSREIFGLELNRTRAAERFLRMGRKIEKFEPFSKLLLAQYDGGIDFGKVTLLTQQITALIDRIFVYIYDMEPVRETQSYHSFWKRLDKMSLATLFVFHDYLESVYGPTLRKLPYKYPKSMEERNEKMNLAHSIGDMSIATIKKWTANFKELLGNDIVAKDNGIAGEYLSIFQLHNRYSVDYFTLDELRSVHNTAAAIFNGKPEGRVRPPIFS